MRTAQLLLAFLATAGPAIAGPADVWFELGLEADLGTNSAPDASAAFDHFLRAAKAGHGQAAFNVAVMLDSGRGVRRDIVDAAAWYGRAAARGDRRAAYNLGQLYEKGEGVPANSDVARTWYEVSGLPAARERIQDLAPGAPRPDDLMSPQAIAPLSGEVLPDGRVDAELVWTIPLQPEPCRYNIELRSVTELGSEEVFAWTADTTAVLVVLPPTGTTFAWRVTAVGRRMADYRTGAWQVFTVVRPSPSKDQR
ncbi:hypothetical protein [uncultured Alsobacter sp.]|uniref:tetratricopeptide repeat protein n=1 Tax=uncultured Alsobacter sp. TaxID=1748258 RepID=UPI0025EBFBE6|nr:hypothetical protein [uncultured Alsobacter sp.]